MQLWHLAQEVFDKISQGKNCFVTLFKIIEQDDFQRSQQQCHKIAESNITDVLPTSKEGGIAAGKTRIAKTMAL